MVVQFPLVLGCFCCFEIRFTLAAPDLRFKNQFTGRVEIHHDTMAILTSPPRIRRANGVSISRWMARFNGRAP